MTKTEETEVDRSTVDQTDVETHIDLEQPRKSTARVQKIVFAGLIAALIAAMVAFGWQWRSTSDQLDQVQNEQAGRAQAEQVALEYATRAAEMDFRDLPTWRSGLVNGTSPELSSRLTQAASSMEQIIVPLQWVSTAQPISAKAEEVNGVYSVDCFVSVLTKNSQAPEGLQSTATYKLTIDSHDWTITEISGVDSALGADTAPK